MRKILTQFVLVMLLATTASAKPMWETTPNCPPDAAFTYCTVAEGYWSQVQFDESLERLALMSRRRLDVVDTQSSETLVSLTPPSAWMEFTGFPAFNSDGSLVACPVTDGTILMWDVDTSELVGTFPSRLRGMLAVFSQDGALLATQSEPGEATLWSTETEQPLFSPSELNAYGYVMPLGFSYDDAFFFASGISLGRSGSRITGAWDVETRDLVRVFPGSVIPVSDGSLYTLETSLSGESTLNDEPTLIMSTHVSLWDGVFGDLVQTFTVRAPIWGASISHTGQLMALGRRDGTIDLWDVEAQHEIYQLDLKGIISDTAGLEYEEAMISVASFSPDDSLLATVVWMSNPANRTYVHLWNISELLVDED